MTNYIPTNEALRQQIAIQREQLADIHLLLDLIECMNLVSAQPWWVETLKRIRHRYAGTQEQTQGPSDLSR